MKNAAASPQEQEPAGGVLKFSTLVQSRLAKVAGALLTTGLTVTLARQ